MDETKNPFEVSFDRDAARRDMEELIAKGDVYHPGGYCDRCKKDHPPRVSNFKRDFIDAAAQRLADAIDDDLTRQILGKL